MIKCPSCHGKLNEGYVIFGEEDLVAGSIGYVNCELCGEDNIPITIGDDLKYHRF